MTVRYEGPFRWFAADEVASHDDTGEQVLSTHCRSAVERFLVNATKGWHSLSANAFSPELFAARAIGCSAAVNETNTTTALGRVREPSCAGVVALGRPWMRVVSSAEVAAR